MFVVYPLAFGLGHDLENFYPIEHARVEAPAPRSKGTLSQITHGCVFLVLH